MRSLRGWPQALAALSLVAIGSAPAYAGDPLKPYVYLILDTSSSMNNTTGAGATSCGSSDTRFNHAKCAINNIANSYGDMVLGLGRFRATLTGSYTPGTSCASSCTTTALSCASTSAANIDQHFQVVTPFIDGDNDQVATFTDLTCGTCGTDLANDPELYEPGSGTPNAGALTGVKKYWQGIELTADGSTVIWPSGSPGFDPIRNDPYKDVFLPSGEQCRPYVTILLTDGNESCGDDYVAATTSLYTTVVDGQNYTIRMRPIGMQAPGANGDPEIEAMAHAGGETDVAGQLEGFYAENEQQLQLAISSIVADALRFETCNGLDDDCDTFVDEDFTSLGAGCSDAGIGACQGQGVYECRADGAGTECVITDPGDAPTDESCNGIDDDCDTHIDEGDVCVGCTGVELCNNDDDDCDGLVDEDLTRPCGTDIGECQAGTETCEAGAWINCDAIGGSVEICDDFDNDCDGSINGIAEACSNLPGGNPGIGECHPGSQICDVSGDFGPCLGEVVPVDEICDTLDNDCDGMVDEDTGGVDCSTDCGLGQTVCVNGVLECNATPADDDDTCNGIDDDCDDSIDEDAPSGGPCDEAGEICNGELICMTGTYVCVGDPIQDVDQCDCEDNDCDDMIDENNGLCPGGSTCSDCACRFPCQPGEFPCAVGQICDQETDLCVEDVCFGVTCDPLPDGTATECHRETGACVSVCEGVTCNEGLICYGPTGECEPDNCSTFPDRCGEGERCEEGACVADPCFGVTCESAQYCFEGDCIGSCAGVDCPSGERCRLGACEPDPCGGDCGSGRVCDDDTGTCVANPCDGETCDPGLVCDPQSGECVDDPCASITCPSPDQVCDFGTCRDPQQIDEDVITTGGGGCSTGGGSASGLALALLALLATRSPRRPSRRDQGGAS